MLHMKLEQEKELAVEKQRQGVELEKVLAIIKSIIIPINIFTLFGNYSYTLKAKTTQNGTGNLKSSVFAVANDIRADRLVEPRVAQSDLGSFLPFIMEGIVSLIGQDNKVLIQILCYTGTFDSFFPCCQSYHFHGV